MSKDENGADCRFFADHPQYRRPEQLHSLCRALCPPDAAGLTATQPGIKCEVDPLAFTAHWVVETYAHLAVAPYDKVRVLEEAKALVRTAVRILVARLQANVNRASEEAINLAKILPDRESMKLVIRRGEEKWAPKLRPGPPRNVAGDAEARNLLAEIEADLKPAFLTGSLFERSEGCVRVVSRQRSEGRLRVRDLQAEKLAEEMWRKKDPGQAAVVLAAASLGKSEKTVANQVAARKVEPAGELSDLREPKEPYSVFYGPGLFPESE